MSDPLIASVTKWMQSAPDEVKAMIAQQTADVTGHKAQKADVNYGKSDNPDECCGTCAHYDGTGGCAVVSGRIDPTYVSDKFVAGSHDDTGESSDGASSRGDVNVDSTSGEAVSAPSGS